MIHNDHININRDILLGYCFVIFGIISGLNTQTTLLNFGWLGRGGAAFPLIMTNLTLNNIEVWYLMAGVIFLVIHALFMGFFLYSYPKEIKLTTRKQTILEIFYLSWIGGFSVIGVHGPRIILTYLARINPQYPEQEAFLKSIGLTMAQWTWGASHTTDEVYSLAFYGAVVIGVYFGILFLLHFVRPAGRKKQATA